MADTALGLTDYAKEMARWNQPFVFREFPKMLYRGLTRAGRVALEERTVETEQEERDATGGGWCPNPQTATARETAAQEAIGTAAAERAYTDRRMSDRAQAEAAAADQAAGAKHLGAIPETPRPPRTRKKGEAP